MARSTAKMTRKRCQFQPDRVFLEETFTGPLQKFDSQMKIELVLCRSAPAKVYSAYFLVILPANFNLFPRIHLHPLQSYPGSRAW